MNVYRFLSNWLLVKDFHLLREASTDLEIDLTDLMASQKRFFLSLLINLSSGLNDG